MVVKVGTLQLGDIFTMTGVEYTVIKKNEERIFFCASSSKKKGNIGVSINKNSQSFSKKSQQKVKLLKMKFYDHKKRKKAEDNDFNVGGYIVYNNVHSSPCEF